MNKPKQATAGRIDGHMTLDFSFSRPSVNKYQDFSLSHIMPPKSKSLTALFSFTEVFYFELNFLVIAKLTAILPEISQSERHHEYP